MVEPVALIALATDGAMGWPVPFYRLIGHPVGLFARLISVCERRWNQPMHAEVRRKVLGVVTVILLFVIVGVVSFTLEQLCRLSCGRWGWIPAGLLAAPGLAQRSLHDHVGMVLAALRRGDLDGARLGVGMIVGRDTATLDEPGLSRAAIESLAESFCDGITAPLFWLLILGLPGVWVYKAINTADSMIGHREERWRAFGWAAARTDDLLNLIPARLTGVLICLCGGGWRVMWRDAGEHASPNAGWPEAAMAGALDLRLAGPLAYDGVMFEKPWIGGGRTDADVADIARALHIYRHACLCLWMIAGVFIWAL
jgi:adenosylcobinamide-phosphate synthase